MKIRFETFDKVKINDFATIKAEKCFGVENLFKLGEIFLEREFITRRVKGKRNFVLDFDERNLTSFDIGYSTIFVNQKPVNAGDFRGSVGKTSANDLPLFSEVRL